MRTVFFSIIIPVYNVENYIEQCLESVVTQEFDSFEVILVDDGSADSSGARCDVYAAQYPNVKVIHQENKGVSAARNIGLDTAVGEWVLFLDGDDWLASGMLEKLCEQIAEEDADLYSYNAYKADESGNVTEKMLFTPENISVSFYSENVRFRYITEELMQYKVGWEVCFRIFRRCLIKEKGICFRDREEVFAEDYLFTFQYLLFAKKIKHLCSVYYFYRQREGSCMQNVDKSSVLERLYHWAEEAYCIVKKENIRYVKKSFDVIYFRLLNYHLQYMLSECPRERLTEELKRLSGKQMHRKRMKRLEKRKNELWKDMVKIQWL